MNSYRQVKVSFLSLVFLMSSLKSVFQKAYFEMAKHESPESHLGNFRKFHISGVRAVDCVDDFIGLMKFFRFLQALNWKVVSRVSRTSVWWF